MAEEGTDETDGGRPRTAPLIPTEADFLVAYSSPPGKHKWGIYSL